MVFYQEGVETALSPVLLTHEYPPFRGGVAVYCRELGRAAVAAGSNLEVWTPGRSGGDEDGVIRLGGGCRLSPWDVAGLAARAGARLSAGAGRQVVAASVGACQAAMVLDSTGCGEGTVWHALLHGSELLKWPGHPIWGPLSRRWLGRVRTVFVVSEATRALFHRAYGDRAHPEVRLARPAPGTEAVRPVDVAARVETEWVVLTVARLHPRKGQVEAARALALLPPDVRSRLIYRVVGRGTPEEVRRLEKACLEGGVRLDYRGEVSDRELPMLYASCDLFLMASREVSGSVEGFGISYVEAGFHGKPSVACRTGGVEEAVRHGLTGLVVNPDRPDELAAAVRTLCEDDALRLEMGRRARDHAASFSWADTWKVIRDRLEA